MAKQPAVRVPEAKEFVQRDPAPEPVNPPRQVVLPAVREVAPPEPGPKQGTAAVPKSAAPKIGEPKLDPPVESIVREAPKPDEHKPEEPQKGAGQTVGRRLPFAQAFLGTGAERPKYESVVEVACVHDNRHRRCGAAHTGKRSDAFRILDRELEYDRVEGHLHERANCTAQGIDVDTLR